jgi:hypothetical protein
MQKVSGKTELYSFSSSPILWLNGRGDAAPGLLNTSEQLGVSGVVAGPPSSIIRLHRTRLASHVAVRVPVNKRDSMHSGSVPAVLVGSSPSARFLLH